MTTPTVPAHFQLHQRNSPVTNAWQPLYSRSDDRSVTIGLFVTQAHCNGRDLLHGGVIASLADNAMGLSAVRAARSAGRPNLSGLTTSLAVDYLAPAAPGTWVEFGSRFAESGDRTPWSTVSWSMETTA